MAERCLRLIRIAGDEGTGRRQRLKPEGLSTNSLWRRFFVMGEGFEASFEADMVSPWRKRQRGRPQAKAKKRPDGICHRF
jgi:hypothetical protein